LLEAAWVAVARNGYDGTSIADIVEAAGFSKGAFFSNFDSKEALLLELLRGHKEQDIAALRQVLEGVEQGETADSAFDRYFVALEDNADWVRLDIELQLHAARNPAFGADYDALQRRNRSAIGELVGMLFVKAGKRPPAVLGDLAVALVHGLVLQQGRDVGATVKLVFESLLATADRA
jgi:AcrR family transcriptional regulator